MSATNPRKGMSLAVAAMLMLVTGCRSEQSLPPTAGPYELRTVTLDLSGCEVAMPPVVDWKDWLGREVFEAAGDRQMCQMLLILRDGMASRLTTSGPVKIFGPRLDRPVDWNRIEHVFLSRTPSFPKEPRRLVLCAVVRGEKSQFCVTTREDGSDPSYGVASR